MEDVCFNCNDIVKVIKNLKILYVYLNVYMINLFFWAKQLANKKAVTLFLLFQRSLHKGILSDRLNL